MQASVHADTGSHLSSCPGVENPDLLCWLKILNLAVAEFCPFGSKFKSLDPIHKPSPWVQGYFMHFCKPNFYSSVVNSNNDDATIYCVFTRYLACKCMCTYINTYRMCLNAKIWFLSVVWKTCSNFWIVVLFAHLFLRLIYVYRLLLSLYLSVYKSTCWAWPSGVGNKIYHLHFHK